MTRVRPSRSAAVLAAVLVVVGRAGFVDAAGPPIAKPAPAPAATQAKPAAAGGAATPTSVEELFLKGVDLYSAQRWVEAEAAFLEVWRVQKTYDVAANLGTTEYRLEKWRDAAEHLAFAVRNWPVAAKAEAREIAKQRFEEVRAKVAAVTITVNVAGADVLVDGKSIGTSPLGADMFLDPGAHRVEARLRGYKTGSTTVQASAGETHAAKIELVREETESSGLGKGTQTALIVGGAVTSAVAFGMGVGFMTAGYGKETDASSLRDELQKETPVGVAVCDQPDASRASRCAELQSKLEDVKRFGTIAAGGFIAGSVLAAATTAFVIWTRTSSSKRAQQQVWVAPAIGTTSQGVSVVGAW